MSIDAVWANEANTIVCWKFSKRWRWQEFHDAVAVSQTMADQAGNTVDLILDMQSTRFIPTDSIAIKNIRRGMDAATSQNGYVIVVTDSVFARILIDIFRRVYPRLGEHLLEARTINEAMYLIDRFHSPLST